MSQVFKRGKYWYFTVPGTKGQERKSTGLTSKKAAQELADSEIARYKLAVSRGFDADVTLEEAIESYIDAGNDRRFLLVIADGWGDQLVREIKPQWVRDHAKDLYPERVGASGQKITAAGNATLNRQVITPVQAVINHAFQSEDGRQMKIEKLDTAKPKAKRAVDWDWHDKFAVNAPTKHMAAMARFMFETGTRISEACRVMPEDVDLAARTVQLQKTKTVPRTTHISRELAGMIAELLALPVVKNRMNKKKANGVFGYASRHAVYNGWKAACDKAGISYDPPHSSGRVSFATETVVRQGVDPVKAAKLGGWSSPKVMMDVYAKAEGLEEIVTDVFDRRGKSGEQVRVAEVQKPEAAVKPLKSLDKTG
jgi:integrase